MGLIQSITTPIKNAVSVLLGREDQLNEYLFNVVNGGNARFQLDNAETVSTVYVR